MSETKRRRKPGRPKKDNALTAVFSVAVSQNEKALLMAKNASKWAREVLVRSARKRQ